MDAVYPDTTYGAYGYWYDPNGVVTILDSSDAHTVVKGIPRKTIPLVWKVVQSRCSDEDSVYITNMSVDARLLNDTIVTCDTQVTLTAEDPGLQNAHGEWKSLTLSLIHI